MADVNVLLTCAGQRVDIVRAFRAALAAGPHSGRVIVSDLDPLSPALFEADLVIDLPPVDDPGYGDAVAAVCRREVDDRSEERRVGKESRSRWSPYH